METRDAYIYKNIKKKKHEVEYQKLTIFTPNVHFCSSWQRPLKQAVGLSGPEILCFVAKYQYSGSVAPEREF